MPRLTLKQHNLCPFQPPFVVHQCRARWGFKQHVEMECDVDVCFGGDTSGQHKPRDRDEPKPTLGDWKVQHTVLNLNI
jgi:hypothetical protein